MVGAAAGVAGAGLCGEGGGVKLEYPFTVPAKRDDETDDDWLRRVEAAFNAHLNAIEASETERAERAGKPVAGGLAWGRWKLRMRGQLREALGK